MAKSRSFQVRVLEAIPKAKMPAVLAAISANRAPPVVPKRVTTFAVNARSEDDCRARVKTQVAKLGHTLRSYNRSRQSDVIVYVEHPDDVK